MSDFFTCYLWWLILGVFIGLILCWLYDFLFRRDDKPMPHWEPLPMRPARIASTPEPKSKPSSKPADAAKPSPKPAAAPKAASGGDAAKAAGFKLRKMPEGVDDLTVIEGIGPKICQLLIDDGITTFEKLANTSYEEIKAILDKAGPNFRLAKPDAWPKEAALAARGEWQALKELQDRLIGGVEFDK